MEFVLYLNLNPSNNRISVTLLKLETFRKTVGSYELCGNVVCF
jgi:hypothetical protein